MLDAVQMYKASGSQHWFRWLDCARALLEMGEVSQAIELCRLDDYPDIHDLCRLF